MVLMVRPLALPFLCRSLSLSPLALGERESVCVCVRRKKENTHNTIMCVTHIIVLITTSTAYRALAARVPHLLRTRDSMFLVEIGGTAQHEAVISLFEATRALRYIRTAYDATIPPVPRCLLFCRI
jgi:hypothetical protein